jgi:hypothetical protein
MTARRLLELLLAGLAAVQAAVPGGYLLPPPEHSTPTRPTQPETDPTEPERELSWTATR